MEMELMEMELEAVNVAYTAAQEAQQIILDLRHYPLVSVTLECRLVQNTSAADQLKQWGNAPFKAEASIHIPLPNAVLARHQHHNALEDTKRIGAAVEKVQELYAAICKLNNALSILADFDLIIRGSVASSRINLSILKRLNGPANPIHEEALRESMKVSISQMRQLGHRDLKTAEGAYYERFHERCPEFDQPGPLRAAERLHHANGSTSLDTPRL